MRLFRHWVKVEGDASNRSYYRSSKASAVLVCYPPASSLRLARDLTVRWILEEAGVRVPKLLAVWPPLCAVLEDFGERGAEEVLRLTPPERRSSVAKRLLAPLLRFGMLKAESAPPWNEPLAYPRLRFELEGFVRWYVEGMLGLEPSRELSGWLDALASKVSRHPVVFCHRDYHLNNLFLLPDRSVGVIDWQDALAGPDCYDLVSLLEERAMPHLLSESERWELAAEAAQLLGLADGWELRFTECAAQRALKVVGTFSRLVLGGKGKYREWLEVAISQAARFCGELKAPSAVTDLLLLPLRAQE